MLTYLTETLDGTFAGDPVCANTWGEAEELAQKHGARVLGVLVEEIPADDELVECLRRKFGIAEPPVVA